MKPIYRPFAGLLVAALVSACHGQPAPTESLRQARQDFHTKLLPQAPEKTPVEPAPPKVFSTVKYPAASGSLAAYLTPDPGDGKRHPAIVWITGGDCNTIGDVWSPAPRDNEQTAAAYRQAGIVMMFPSLRGGNDNPGVKEGFLGEVDDVLAAAKFLAQQPYVDPARIYLGGHSTGGTLALLTAEDSPFFRAAFAYGPAAEARDYGLRNKHVPADLSQPQENKLRSPLFWLASNPDTHLGARRHGRQHRCIARPGQSFPPTPKCISWRSRAPPHFATLAPTNELIARQILQDTGAACNVTLTADEVKPLLRRDGVGEAVAGGGGVAAGASSSSKRQPW